MRICFYSPYVPDHFGGGEKHLFDVALSAARFHEVSIAISARKINETFLEKTIAEYRKFLDKDLSKLSFISTPLGTSESFLHKLKWTRQFDGLYYVTDGSLFFSLAKHNYLHIQVPFNLKKNTFVDRLKLNNWSHKNTNSFFTKAVVEDFWKTKITEVIQPMVNLDEFKATIPKKKVILNVGRFFKQLHSKRQDVLIDCFQQLCDKHPTLMEGWQLLLVGSVEDEEYVSNLQDMIKTYNVKLLHSVGRKELVDLYESASIYWHATGYDVEELLYPEKVEHFGISTVEAMAAGAIPIVQYKGGQKEILGNELQHLGWITKEDCIQKTAEIINNEHQAKTIKHLVCDRASAFSKVQFDAKIKKMFSI